MIINYLDVIFYVINTKIDFIFEKNICILTKRIILIYFYKLNYKIIKL